MFEKLKGKIKKSFFYENSSDWGWFYPSDNTQFGKRSLNRTDYLNLYTWWVYTAVTTIWNNMSDLEYVLKKNKESDDTITHPYMDLITSDLILGITSYLQLNWSCFIYKSKIWNTIEWLNILRPDQVQMDFNNNWEIVAYRYISNGKQFKFMPEEIMAIHLFNPTEAYPYQKKWIAPVQAVAIQMESDIATQTWNWNFFKNNWSVKEVLSTDSTLDEKALTRLESQWKTKHSWVNNAHKLAVLTGWLKYQSVSPSQREMDFVEWRRFTRDEVMGIFKVPKAMIWMWEWVNVWNVKAFEVIFAKRVLSPLAKQISEAFNRELFDWIGYFQFINIVPLDKEELRADFEAWVITINEYRQSIWKNKLKEWNVLKLNLDFTSWEVHVENSENKKTTSMSDTTKKSIGNILKAGIGKYEKAQQDWEKKILRNNNYEADYTKQINDIFDRQLSDILKALNRKNKKVNISENDFKATDYLLIWQLAIWPIQKNLVQSEWNQALSEVWVNALFQIWDPSVNKFLRDNIEKFSKEVDTYTRDQIFDIIADWNTAWLWIEEISESITAKFWQFKISRSINIARTETIRAWTYATQKAWEDSEVVTQKEWFTANDERVCPNCWPMQGKVVDLSKDFFKKGQTAPGGLKLTYENIKGAPLHPQCRCTLLPVISE